MKKYAIGIDLGGRSIKFGLFTEDGELVNKSTVNTRIDDGGKYILSDAYDHILKIMEKHDLNSTNLMGIGMGVPGSVTQQRYVNKAVNLGWDFVDIKEYFDDKLDLKILVENDANVAALGEAWVGVAKDYQSIVMVTLGTGVGGGIIVDGKILSGKHGSGGEIGHMPLLKEPLSRTCGCGNNRCFEQVASATGIENIALDYLFENEEDSILREVENITAKDIFDAFEKNDHAAMNIADQYFSHLARGLAIIAAVVDPEAFVLGGGVSNAGDLLLDNVRTYYKKYCFVNNRDVDIKIAALGNDAGIYGAAKLVL